MSRNSLSVSRKWFFVTIHQNSNFNKKRENFVIFEKMTFLIQAAKRVLHTGFLMGFSSIPAQKLKTRKFHKNKLFVKCTFQQKITRWLSHIRPPPCPAMGIPLPRYGKLRGAGGWGFCSTLLSDYPPNRFAGKNRAPSRAKLCMVLINLEIERDVYSLMVQPGPRNANCKQ